MAKQLSSDSLGGPKAWVVPENSSQKSAWSRFVDEGFARTIEQDSTANGHPFTDRDRELGPAFRVTLEGLRAYLRAVEAEPEGHFD